jgi:hypothetical protein
MGRKADNFENGREKVEGQLACLGNAMALLCMVSKRIKVVVDTVGHQELILPAMEDLVGAEKLIARAQRSIVEGFGRLEE